MWIMSKVAKPVRISQHILHFLIQIYIILCFIIYCMLLVSFNVYGQDMILTRVYWKFKDQRSYAYTTESINW